MTKPFEKIITNGINEISYKWKWKKGKSQKYPNNLYVGLLLSFLTFTIYFN